MRWLSGAPMRDQKIPPTQLVPTDSPRSLRVILSIIYDLSHGIESSVPALRVLRDSAAKNERYFVVQGNHRGAAAFVCKRAIRCLVLEVDSDLILLTEGSAREHDALISLELACRKITRSRDYDHFGWDQYFRDLARPGLYDEH